jgi:Na+/proline symporter
MRYKDEFMRVTHQAKQEAINRRRKLMTVTPNDDGTWDVNGNNMDYSSLNCPTDWVDLLDPALCLPWTQMLNPAVDTSFRTPMGVAAQCTYEDYADGELNALYGCAAPDPFGAAPVCDTFIESCAYSKNSWPGYSRTTPDGFDPPNYPRASNGECTKRDAATQWLDCGVPCPAPDPVTQEEKMTTFGIPVIVFIVVSSLFGIGLIVLIKADFMNYIIAGRKLPMFVCAMTLAAQGLDSGIMLGNFDYAYMYHFWDGACLPIGTCGCLIISGTFYVKPVHKLKLLTPADVYAVKFGRASALMYSVYQIFGYLCFFAANLVGFGKIIRYIFGLDGPNAGIAIAGITVWLYTVAGGLISVAYTDVFQVTLGVSGVLVGGIYILTNMPRAAGVSPGYPLGDQTAFAAGAFDVDAYAPIPNAIVFNWSAVWALSLGGIGCLDFNQRIMAAKDGMSARVACYIAGCLVLTIGLICSACGGTIRALYGPSSPSAEFVADSCSKQITIVGCADYMANCNAMPLVGVPTCGEWKPDPAAALKLMTCFKDYCHYFLDFDGSAGYGAGDESFHPMPAGLGAWMLIAIVAGSMSSGDGAILACSTAFTNNIVRPIKPFSKEKLLLYTRCSTIVWTAVAMIIAFATPDLTGTLLVLAFDIAGSGTLVTFTSALFFQDKDGNPKVKPKAAFLALNAGAISRLVLQFALPHDYLYVIGGVAAKCAGPGLYTDEKLNVFFNPDATDAEKESVCPQNDLFDMSGVDTFLGPLICLITLLIAQKIVKDDYYTTPDTSYWFKPVPLKDCQPDTAEDKKTSSKDPSIEQAVESSSA